MRKLEFSIDHSYDAATVLVDTLIYIVITVIQIAAELADVMLLSPDLRTAEKDLKDLISDYHFLKENGIHTVSDLQANIDESKAQLSDLERERKTLSNRIRRPKSEDEKEQNKTAARKISAKLKPLREDLKTAMSITKRYPHILELLETERAMEAQVKTKNKERNYER